MLHGGAFDQRGRLDLAGCTDELPLASRDDVLVFRTPPLAQPLEVTGPLEIHLWVSSSAVDTNTTREPLAAICSAICSPESVT